MRATREVMDEFERHWVRTSWPMKPVVPVRMIFIRMFYVRWRMGATSELVRAVLEAVSVEIGRLRTRYEDLRRI